METMGQPQQRIFEPLASQNEVLEAARELAAALVGTPAYQAFEQAQLRLRQDVAAQEAIHALQKKQQALGWQLQMGLFSDAEREELQRLQQAMLAQPAVQAYVNAQVRLGVICQEVAGLISEVIGLSFAASCGPGCSCG